MIGSVMDGAPGKRSVGQIRLVDSDSPSWIRNEDLRDFGSEKRERVCLSLCVSKHSSSIGDYMSAFARVLYFFSYVKERNEN